MNTKEKTLDDFFGQDQPFVKNQMNQSADWTKLIPDMAKLSRVDTAPLMAYLSESGRQDMSLIMDINSFGKTILYAALQQFRANVYHIQRELDRKERFNRLLGIRRDGETDDDLITVRAHKIANDLMVTQLAQLLQTLQIISEVTVQARSDLYKVMIQMIRELSRIYGV